MISILFASFTEGANGSQDNTNRQRTCKDSLLDRCTSKCASCMIQLKLLVCDTQAKNGILLSKMALEQLQTWQDYSNNTLYVKQTAIPLHAIQNIELLPDRKTTIELIADKTNELQYKDIIGGQGIVLGMV